MPDAVTPRPWRRLAGFLARHRAATLVVVGLSALEAVPALLSGLLVARAVDHGFLAGRTALGLGLLAALAVVTALGALVTRVLTPRLGALVEPLRDELVTEVVDSTLRRSLTEVRGADGAGVARITGQVETVRALVSALLRSARHIGATLVMALIGITALSPSLGLLVAPPLVLTALLSVPVLRRLARREQAELVAQERMSALAGDTFLGVRDLVAGGARDRAGRDLDATIAAHQAATRATSRTTAMNHLLVATGGWAPALAVLLAAPALLGSGALTVGGLVGAVTYLASHVAPAVSALVSLLGSWGVQLHIVLRHLTLTSLPPDGTPGGPSGDAGSGTGGKPVTPAGEPGDHGLTFEGLTFSYGPHAVPVIDSLDLDVPAGTHLAVVGPSGVGKSTLASLVAGLAEPTGGRLLWGCAPPHQLGVPPHQPGVPPHQLDRDWLGRHLALIPQEAYVFTGTVRDNLRYLRPEATDAELLDAAHEVGAGPLLRNLGGLDAPLGLDGPELSSGQRQLVALARAYAADTPVVVLDEACCHLDQAAEARAERAFAARGGTLLVIAHRVSSALRAQRILVMDGERTTVGTHEELLDRSPLYADLFGHWTRRPEEPGELAGPPGDSDPDTVDDADLRPLTPAGPVADPTG
ncbi:ABC transporter ATP-binding protein [Streptomyces sp. NPDC005438]|uniref:ABC transporter ATP-binding protein n=1 Tax=Streptomyces sp. NPDC005438 TaxID=3156880 RepID=UPI0033BC2B8C